MTFVAISGLRVKKHGLIKTLHDVYLWSLIIGSHDSVFIPPDIEKFNSSL